MSPFKRTISHLFRFPSKFRRPQPDDDALPADTTVACRESNWLRKIVYPACKSVLQPPTDIDATEVEENEEVEVDDKVDEKYEHEDKDVGVDEHVDEHNDENENEGADADVDVDDDDTPEAFPFDLVHKTRIEMMIHHLYVALSDDDREIAALRTRHRERFTHVVRITFEPPSVDDKLTPSAWSKELTFPNNGPFELRLQCPNFARRLGEQHTALTKTQLLLARKYITFSLPYRRDTWLEHGFKFPFSMKECQDARLLIVGPTDRSVDVMTILVCYLAFLTGARAAKLLDRVNKLDLVHPHWKNYALGHVADAAPMEM